MKLTERYADFAELTPAILNEFISRIGAIPTPAVAVSMGCDIGCHYIGRTFDDNWGLPDPTGKSDKCFKLQN